MISIQPKNRLVFRNNDVKHHEKINGNQRRVDLELMRIIACFLVIFNHLDGYHLYMNADSSLQAWIYMFPAMITRINVPLFL